MRIREVIEEFIPCEVCGNSDVNNFYFHVFYHWGSEPFVKCCECEEEYYSSRAKKIISGIQNARKAKKPQGQLVSREVYDDCEIEKYTKPATTKFSQV